MTEYIALDLEMTGLDPKTDRIIEIGASHCKDGQEVRSYSTLINPQMSLSEHVTELTGITQDMVSGCADGRQPVPTIDEALPAFLEWMGNLPILGHNIRFDYSFLVYAAGQQKLPCRQIVRDRGDAGYSGGIQDQYKKRGQDLRGKDQYQMLEKQTFKGCFSCEPHIGKKLVVPGLH